MERRRGPAGCDLVRQLVAAMVVIYVFLEPATTTAARTCGMKSPFVGFKGPLSQLEHDVGGEVEIIDDCTAKITMASYDGLAPAAYWWCSASASSKDQRAGFKANDNKLTTALNGLQTVTVQLDDHLFWGDCPVLGVWCEMFSADFGHVELKAANGSAVQVPARNRTTSAVLPAGMADSLDNCLELIPGKLNMYWKLDKPAAPTSVKMTLQGVMPDNSWMAFGFSDPSKPEASMIGGDVVVVGLVQGKGFAVDYYLSKRDQCNYSGAQDEGVCPDSGYKKSPADNNAKMTAFTSIAGVVTVTFTRTLKTASPYDHPWAAAKAAAPALYAMGPLSEQSNAQQQVVLYHGLARSDPSFKVTLGATGNKCPTPLSGAPVNKTQGGQVGTIFGRTTFEVTTGPNPNYPNPPAWGLSYHINGVESPVLRVYRGTEYTFNVMAGDQHPLYLTSDITGGNSNAMEKIYAGGETSFGAPGKPLALKWMPSGATPAGLYYQCFVHQKLGWKIQVVDEGDTGACSKTHPYVGYKGMLSQLDHGVAGAVEVLDDCTFVVRGFKYDGQAPAVHFYGAKEDKNAAFKAGGPLGPRLTQAYNGGEDVTVRLPASASWDTVGAISVWCEQFSANFGSLGLKPGPGAAPAGGNGTASCVVTTDTGKATYDSCVDLPGAAAGLRFYYSLSQAPSGKAVVKGALQTSALDGWVALGFAQTPNVMVGANAVIMRQTPKGIVAKHYHLGARTVEGVVSPSKLAFKLNSAAATSSRRRKLHAPVAATTTFEVELETPYATALTQPLPLIYASGPTDVASGDLRPHTLATAKGTSIVLGRKMTGGAAAASGGSGKVPRLRKVHGFLMGIGWGVLVPLGIAAAHSFKAHDPLWFYAHIACQVTGFLLGAAGFGIGIYLGSETKGVTYKSHRIVGIVVFALSILQVLLGLGRPGKASRLRRAWELAHHWTGRAAALLAIINIYRGFDILEGLGTSVTAWKIALSVVLGAIVAAALLKSWVEHLALPPPAEVEGNGDGKAAGGPKKDAEAGSASNGTD